MRKERFKKIIFLVLILSISIGFAILTANLSLNSNINIASASWNISLYQPEIYKTNTEGGTYSLNSDSTQLNLSVSLDSPGDYIDYDFYIRNTGTIDGVIDNITISGLDSYQDYLTYDLKYFSGSAPSNGDLIKANTNKRVKFHLEYKYDVSNFINTDVINVTINFTFKQPKTTNKVWDYTYSEDVQEFVADKSGTYKLEVWGAQGGTGSFGGVDYNQGYGGYSNGNVVLNKGDKLYILVGQKGVGLGAKIVPPSFNGGGSAYLSRSTEITNSSGGGGTSIFEANSVVHHLGRDVKNAGYDSATGLVVPEDQLSIDGDSLVLNFDGNYNIYNGFKKEVGSFYKVVWRGVGLSNSKIVYDGGIYREGDTVFQWNVGVRIYYKYISDTVAEIYYEITEENRTVEFRLETFGAPVTIHSRTIIKIDNPLIIAGGGGGVHLHVNGKSYAGNGGGYIGSSPINIHQYYPENCTIPTGGTQSSGGINASMTGFLGVGGNYVGGSFGAGGGGGYYGGAPGRQGNACAYSGAGGSGYIGNTNLTNKVMYCYNCQESSEVSTKTISTTNVSETPISNYAKIGNGHARITFIE